MKRLITAMGLLFLGSCSSPHKDRCGHHHKPVTMGFAGDVMIGRSINKLLAHKEDFAIWGNALELLKKNSILLVNLETTLTRSEDIVPKVFNFKSDPKNVAVLKQAHITVVNLANNHSLDFGPQGLAETIKTLNKARIAHVGAGKHSMQAKKPVIVKKCGLRIGIIGYTDNEPGWKAQEDKPGTNYIRVGDIESVREDIKQIRPKVDLLVASIHWGPNMQQRPSPEVIDFAHQMIEEGIDIIHGHSSHVFQGIEWYKNRLILYDMGDLIDDYVIDPALHNDETFLCQVTINAHGIQGVKVTPLVIKHMQLNRAEGDQARQIIKRISELSAEFFTVINPDGSLVIKNTSEPYHALVAKIGPPRSYH